MKTIKDYIGNICTLSDDLYCITTNEHPSKNYKKGTVVRLISGVDGVKIPGYHWNPLYATVSREDVNPAHFVGIKRSSLRKISPEKQRRA
jgi:hypothetical protein